MPVLWGKTRCVEAAGWQDRVITKLAVAGAPPPQLGGASGGRGGGQPAGRLRAAAALPASVLPPVQDSCIILLSCVQAARGRWWAACCRWCSGSRWCASLPHPQPPSSCWQAASQVGGWAQTMPNWCHHTGSRCLLPECVAVGVAGLPLASATIHHRPAAPAPCTPAAVQEASRLVRCRDSPANSVLAGAATGALLYKSHGEPLVPLPLLRLACLPAPPACRVLCRHCCPICMHAYPAHAPAATTLTMLPCTSCWQAGREPRAPSLLPPLVARHTCFPLRWTPQAACRSCSSAWTF